MIRSFGPDDGAASRVSLWSIKRLKAVSQWDKDSLVTMSMIWYSSVLVDFRNFFRAGVLKKRSLTSIVVPRAGESLTSLTIPPESSTDTPRGFPCGAVTRVTFETDAIEEIRYATNFHM